ncbi:hypothetical protein C1H46_000732 [Malus baccata]|uniref:CobQ/CobB/MinD/ParA nucleotide binding domain-containing protein n=1 Tax=Malus baccata TaxID=106549 RepID=A0A540NRU0_MALBA|nr:hypothetical protein C1H46_000732 [Malus baccata]
MRGLLKSFTRVGGGVRGYSSARKDLRIEGVKHAIAVASGKGGVGKSTTAVNLAVALANKCQMKVGLLDADIYGPNVPIMMKLDRKPEVTDDKKMIPIESYGVKCMSMGLLVDKDAPLVWRGPMVSSALEKMTRGVNWGNLDILVVDMPPGTGDAHITVSQRLQLSAEIPLEVGIRKGSDNGVPIVISAPDSDVSKAYVDVARRVVDRLAKEEQSRPQISL